jgi:hypothetical protein
LGPAAGASAIVMVPPGTFTIVWLLVVVDVVVAAGLALDPQAARTRAAAATASPTVPSLVSLRFRIMIVPDLLNSTCVVG